MRNLFLAVFALLMLPLLGSCAIPGWDCPPGEDCNYYAPPYFLGEWQAEAEGARFSKVIISGVVNSYHADLWENCPEPACHWGQAVITGELMRNDFPNDPKFETDALTFRWDERTPRVMHELWILGDDRAVLKTMVETDDGFDLDNPDYEDILVRVTRP
jgi:hypothetical protein